VHEARSLRS